MDKEVFHSENHPDLKNIGSPKTKTCMKANKAKNTTICKSAEHKWSLSSSKNEGPLVKVKKNCFTFSNIAECILDNRIRTYTSLQGIALTCTQEGENELFSFLARNTSKSVQEIVECVWSMHGAAENENLVTISRMEKLISIGNQECTAMCNRK